MDQWFIATGLVFSITYHQCFQAMITLHGYAKSALDAGSLAISLFDENPI
jgi:hypothetical protein